ncbi:MAG: EamA family transporter RarD [Streptosporangiales bacterium]|nr:EamA family transporter RarD [Streptosporangiales bacterium]
MSDVRRGVWYGIAAYALWGLFPLYWPLLEPAGAVEILAHRVLWSLVVVLVILTCWRRWGYLAGLLRGGARARAGLLVIAGSIIGVNWGLYIWGVNNGRVLEVALGFFVNPLIAVLLGVLVFGERLRPLQWAAVGFGVAAVVVLSVGYGRLPWLALVLGTVFATYSSLKKKADVDAVESLAVETAALTPAALVYVLVLEAAGAATFGHVSVGHTLLLVSAGVTTAIPLLFFGAAAIRIPLTLIGLLQYLAPTAQLLIGVFVYGEPLPPSRLAGFVLVWFALLLLVLDGFRTARPRRLVESPA